MYDFEKSVELVSNVRIIPPSAPVRIIEEKEQLAFEQIKTEVI